MLWILEKVWGYYKFNTKWITSWKHFQMHCLEEKCIFAKRDLKMSSTRWWLFCTVLDFLMQVTMHNRCCLFWVYLISFFNSLPPGKFKWNSKILNFQANFSGWWLKYHLWNSSQVIDTGPHWWYNSMLVQVMACCLISHYLSQCWPISLWPYGITRPQWVLICTKTASIYKSYFSFKFANFYFFQHDETIVEQYHLALR